MTIFVDADACPVKAEAERVASRHGLPLKLVCNGGLRPSPNPLVEVVIVDEGPDEADRWIARRAGPGDIVVTSDIPLAQDCVTAGAAVLQHDGTELRPDNIVARRATRDLMADLRGADPFHQGRGRSFAKADRARFLQALERAVQAAQRRP